MLPTFLAFALAAAAHQVTPNVDRAPLALSPPPPHTLSQIATMRSAALADRVISVRLAAKAKYELRVVLRGERRAVGFDLRGRMLFPLSSAHGALHRSELATWIGPATSHDTIELTLRPLRAATLLTLQAPGGQVLAVAQTDAAPGGARIELSGQGTTVVGATQRRRCESIPADDGPPLTVETELRGAASAIERTSDGTSILRLTPATLEALDCAGRSYEHLRTVLPWKHIEPASLPALRAPLPPSPVDLARAYKSPEQVYALLRRWHRQHPTRTRLEVLGQSHQGRPIVALAVADEIAQPDERPTLLLNGAHHGDELNTVDVVLDAAQQLLTSEQPALERIRASVITWLVPLVNPDGNAVFLYDSTRAGRKNGRDLDGDGTRGLLEGVDLNRNYPAQWGFGCERGCPRAQPHSSRYRGRAEASEPETRALMALARRERFEASISYHMGTVAVLYPRAGAGDPILLNLAREVAQGLGPRFRPRPPNAPVRGADQDWLYQELGTRALLVEIHGWPPPNTQEARRALIESSRPSWIIAARMLATIQKSSTNSR